MNLFQNQEITSAAGLKLPFKIDCDALTDEDIMALAVMAKKIISPSRCIGVPTGGIRFAAAIEATGLWEHGYPVIIDDVWTTGTSVLKVASANGLIDEIGHKVLCCVIFARGDYPHWVKPIFDINRVLRAQSFIWNKEYR